MPMSLPPEDRGPFVPGAPPVPEIEVTTAPAPALRGRVIGLPVPGAPRRRDAGGRLLWWDDELTHQRPRDLADARARQTDCGAGERVSSSSHPPDASRGEAPRDAPEPLEFDDLTGPMTVFGSSPDLAPAGLDLDEVSFVSAVMRAPEASPTSPQPDVFPPSAAVVAKTPSAPAWTTRPTTGSTSPVVSPTFPEAPVEIPLQRRSRWVAVAVLVALLGVVAMVFGLRAPAPATMVTATPPPPVAADLRIGGDPSVRVALDGHDVGTLPLSVRWLPGRYEVTLSAPRWQTRSLVVHLKAGKTTDLGPVAMSPARTKLRLERVTPGAYVVLFRRDRDGGAAVDELVVEGPFPRTLELPPGVYEVVANKLDYPRFSRRVDTAIEPERTVVIDLGPPRAEPAVSPQDDRYRKVPSPPPPPRVVPAPPTAPEAQPEPSVEPNPYAI